MIRCPYCGTQQEIKGWSKDDPVLACGHTRHCLDREDSLVKVWESMKLLKTFISIKVGGLVEDGMSRDQANILVTEEYTRNPLSVEELRKQIGNRTS